MRRNTTGSNMYARAKTWNPFKGCQFDCTYCGPSFRAQAKRQKNKCMKCYEFAPHTHPERVSKPIPDAEIIFVCGNGDISFAPPEFIRQILDRIRQENLRRPDKTYYLQSKRPAYFGQFIEDLPENVILVTTLETNRDEGYSEISKAPVPLVRYEQFLQLDYPRKVITIEPVLDFDVDIFAEWIVKMKPEYVWLGLNSRDTAVRLPEPSAAKLQAFVKILTDAGIAVRGKKLRGRSLSEPDKVAPTIFTISTQGMHDDDFMRLLKQHGIDAIVDVRLKPEGPRYRFASGKHIRELVESHGIAYAHEPAFAPTKELFDLWPDWQKYEPAYIRLITERDMGAIWRDKYGHFVRPCLLAAESPDLCHRRLLAEFLAAQQGIPVVHITRRPDDRVR